MEKKAHLLIFRIFLICLGMVSFALAQDDLVKSVILPEDPKTPSEFIEVLRKADLAPSFHVVANRGACNPAKGSFSVFGDVGPQLTFGIFVEPDKEGVLQLQESFKTRLLIEVIAEDRETGLKNFWELIGDGESSDWHYRGNSLDVLADIEAINMGPTHEPVFGKRLRCSGCHTGGDLVMKERFPYNDWQNEKPLETGRYVPSSWVAKVFEEAEPAHHLSGVVEESLRDYVRALEARSPETRKQWARSLFAPLEMNLVSDTKPFRERLRLDEPIEIPAAFFVDPLLSGEQPPVKVSSKLYLEALKAVGSQFAPDETPGYLETQHAFLVPVRSRFDTLRIESMIRRGWLSKDLVEAVLAVDFEQPMYSEARLGLMERVPTSWESVGELSKALSLKPSAKERAVAYLEEQRKMADSLEAVVGWLREAHRSRLRIQAAQTSQNPRGAILEGGLGPDGFRRIFPQYSDKEI